MIEITSKANSKIKELVKLQNNQKRKKSHFLLVEGQREVSLALAHHFAPDHFFVCTDFIEDSLLNEIKQTEANIYQVDARLYKSIAYREQSGVIGVFHKPENTLASPSSNLVLILDNIEKPGNLGALYRSANAFGVKEIIHTGDKNIDLYHPNSIRASLGGIFSINLSSMSYEEALDYCNKHNLEVCVTSAKNSTDIHKFDKPQKMALILGSEEKGANDFWLTNAKHRLLIPMKGNVSSLNVSVAGGIGMFCLGE